MTMLVKKAFISSEFIPSVSLCPLPWAFLFSRVLRKENFPIKKKRLPEKPRKALKLLGLLNNQQGLLDDSSNTA